jgi:uncharacterized protein (DUF362 family)
LRYKFSISRIEGNVRHALERVIRDAELDQAFGSSVFIKPNFTFPSFKPGVTTTREVLEALVCVLRDAGCKHIAIGEGDGGYNSYAIEETFANFGLGELARQYGVKVVNVCKWPSTAIRVEARRGRFEVNLPKPLFTEFDSFITVPVPKVHAMTRMSNAVKNQWGLLQDMRVYFHCGFDEIITEVNRMLPNPMAIVDGTYGLTRNGPMIEGEALRLNWISACDNLWLNDRLVCDLMGFDWRSIDHLRFAARQGLMPNPEQCRVSAQFGSFKDDRFYLKRNMWNWAAKATWYSPRLNHLVYFSKASGILHRIMYSIRKKPAELKVKGFDW